MSEQQRRDPHEWRFERKFNNTDLSYAEVESIVRLHPALFRPIFQPRWVNNIYFDSSELDSFHDNVDGALFRTKSRIRWYGELFGTIEKPILEFKFKRGLLGRKETHRLAPFFIGDGFDSETVSSNLSASDLPETVILHMKNSTPTLVNRYCRKYFRSADGRYRITMDSEQQFYSVGPRNNRFLCRAENNNDVILELKYAQAHDMDAEQITTQFPFRLSKSSKYVSGVELTHP
jgi:hypothetical protein